jgi:hypothetical protein
MVVRTFPGFQHIYRISDPGDPGGFVADIGLSTQDGLAALRGDRQIQTPVSLRWRMGRRTPDDFIWTTIAIPFIVSERVIAALEDCKCSGWDTYPIALVGAAGEPIPGYHGLVVRGRCGPLEKHRSVEIRKQYPGGVFPAYRGWYFDERAWDGSDVFMPGGRVGHVFITQDAKDALSAARISGADFDRADLAERTFL